MRILIIHNILNDSRSVNGVLRHFAWMAEEWNKSGHPTDFVVAKAGFPQLRELAPSAQCISSDNIFNATKHIHQTWRYFPAYGFRMLSAHWLRFAHGYDVVYASAPVIFEMYPALVLQRKFKATLAVKVHHVVSAQEKRRGVIDRLFFLSEKLSARWINKHADVVICSTPLVERDFAEVEKGSGLTPSKKVLIGYGIDYDRLAAWRSQPKQYDAVILSRIHEQKGVFDIPIFWKSVLAKKPDAKLLVIGEGAHRPRAQQLVANAGLQDAITFTGGVPEEEKNRLVAGAKVGVSLSYEEGWGLAINEFLAFGLPVIAYELPVFHYAFPNELILVPCGDARAAGEQVAKLLSQDTLRSDIGLRGAQFARRYDFKELAKVELDALQDAAAKRRS